MKTLGEIAFDGYMGAIDHGNPSRIRISWDETPTSEKCAWQSSARAVLDYLVNQQSKPQHHQHD